MLLKDLASTDPRAALTAVAPSARSAGDTWAQAGAAPVSPVRAPMTGTANQRPVEQLRRGRRLRYPCRCRFSDGLLAGVGCGAASMLLVLDIVLWKLCLGGDMAVPDPLRPLTVLCSFCGATSVDGAGRTLWVIGEQASVTWHCADCPHYAADRILAERDA